MPQWHRNLPEALSREESQRSSPNTLPKLLSSPPPSATLPRTLLITLDRTTVFWKKPTHLQPTSSTPTHTVPWHAWTYPSCHLSSPSPFSTNLLGCRSLSSALPLSPCPIGLCNYTSLQKEKSRNKPTNGLSVNCLLYGRNKLPSVRKHLYLLIIAARSLLLRD